MSTRDRATLVNGRRIRRVGAWIAVVAVSLGVSSATSADSGDFNGRSIGLMERLVGETNSLAGDPLGAGGAEEQDPRPTPLQPGTLIGDRIGGVSPSQPGSERYIVRVRSRVDLERVVQRLIENGARPTKRWQESMFGVVVDLNEAALRDFRDEPGVLSIEPDRPVHQVESQVSPPWGLDRIDQRTRPLDDVYRYAATGVGVTAYVIDTGLWLTHDEFVGRVSDGAFWDFGDGTRTRDCNGHGTHVAGTLGGTTYGVAKSVSVVPVKVLDCSGSGSTSAVIAGIDWVISHHATGEPAVANLSLGGDASPSLDAAVEALIADGVTVVVAAGNDAAPACDFSPARVPSALTVAASTSRDQPASYSNHGSCNDIFAPGSNTLSAYAGSNTATQVLSGTSMAAPHVAGAVALLLESNPAATPATIATALDSRSTKNVLTTAGDPSKLLPNKLLYVGEDLVLSVTKDGSGTGTAFSSSAAIDCGSTCAASIPAATVVNLFADPATGSAFSGWSGGGCTGTASCAVTMGASTTVTATFTLGSHELNISTAGSGSGVVSSSSMTCATSCTTTHPHNSLVTLVATPNPGSTFTGWSGGGCTGTASCAVTVGASTTVTATFAGSSFAALEPARLMDTRIGGLTVDGAFAGVGVRTAGSVTELTVLGRGGVPSDAGAVVLNVTVTEPGVAGFVTVFPCGDALPNASNVNYAAGQTVANAVVAKVGVGGKVCVYTLQTAQLVVDVNGFFYAGSSFAALEPARLMDTRIGGLTVDGAFAGVGVRTAGSVTELTVLSRGGVPSDAGAVVLNVTVTEPGVAGFVTVFPCGDALPNASNVNYAAGQTVANAVVAKVGVGGKVCVYTLQTAQLVVDVNGSV